MKLRLVAMVGGLVLSTTLAFADLDRKQAGALSRAATQITNTEASLEDYGEGARWGVMTERVQGDFDRKIERAKTLLAGLPADDKGVKDELARLAKVEALLAAKVAQRTSRAAAAASAQADIDALLAHADFEPDHARLVEMKKIFENATWWGLDHYHFARWVDHSDVVEMRGWGQQWPQLKTDFPALRTKYAKVIAAKLATGSAQKQIALKELAGDDANARFLAFGAAHDAFVKGVPAAIEADGKRLRELVETAGNKNDWAAILDPDGKIQGVRNRLVNVPSVYATVATAAESATVAKAAKAANEGADSALAKFAEKLVASNTAPSNAYFKADRDALEAFVKKAWKAKYANETIIAVRLRTSEFERTTEWVHDSSRNALTKRDVSKLRATVIVKHGAKEAAMWSVIVMRDHMKNDALALGWVYRGSAGPTPEQRMLISNFK
jgi:hypothetical protein